MESILSIIFFIVGSIYNLYYNLLAPILIPYWKVIFSIFVVLLILRKISGIRPWRIRHSYRVLKRLKKMTTNAERFGYLRRIDPFVFEEVILSALKQRGHKIRRNRKYTGDGGIDGKVKIGGVWHLIQAKRYSSAINPQHIREFNRVCRRHRKPGLFVHTGRTGKMSREAVEQASEEIMIVSGESLIELLGLKTDPKLELEQKTWS